MSDSLADQGDALLAALTGAIDKGRTVEYEAGHPSHREPGDVTLEPGERYVDDLQGHGSYLAAGRPSDSLEAAFADALGMTMPARLKPIGR